ncbi:MAG: hypothetical protein ACI8TP_003089 [Acidimicrobiales bacterium]|jgi:hypothetical protein
MTKDPNFAMGISFLAIGLALTVVLDPWFLGMAFLLMGAHRLYVAYTTSNADGS